VLWGGVGIVPNLLRGSIAGFVTFLHEGSSREQAQAFVDAAPTNRTTISGLTIVNGFFMSSLRDLLPGGFGQSLAQFAPQSTVGVLIASGQNMSWPTTRSSTATDAARRWRASGSPNRVVPRLPRRRLGRRLHRAGRRAARRALQQPEKSDEASPQAPVQVQAPATGSGHADPAEQHSRWNTAGS